MKMITLNILLIIVIFLAGCKEDHPIQPDNKQKLTLEKIDASCTEAWIQLTAENLQFPAEINLKRTDANGSSKDLIFYVSTEDTLLYVDSLLPKKAYQYQASSIQNPVSSNEISVTTMDTTSHNFSFQTWTFGTIGSSVLHDVVIINENNIWAVGEITIADTSVNGSTTYNAVHWDGSEWELKRIKTNACGGVEYPPIKAIFSFSADDILFAHIDGSITHFNGTEFINDCSLITQLNGSANKIWGISKNDYYVVSGNGFIAHFKGSRWQEIESGTELNINDIWGDYNEQTGEWEVLAVASDYGANLEKEILQINEQYVIKLSTDANPTMEPLLTCWFITDRIYFVAGSGIYKKTIVDSIWYHKLFEITTFATTSIRGNEMNDIIGVGAFGDFLHFNGLNWKNDYEEPELSNGSYTSVAVKDNLVIAVGGNQASINSEAVILMGGR